MKIAIWIILILLIAALINTLLKDEKKYAVKSRHPDHENLSGYSALV